MKSCKFAIAAICVCASAFNAGAAVTNTLSELVVNLRDAGCRTRLNAIGAVDELIAASSNRDDAAACRLVKATLLLEKSEIDLDDAAWDEATNLCGVVETAFADSPGAWQVGAAALIRLGAQMTGGDCDAALSTATNALARTSAAYDQPVSSCVLFADFPAERLRGVSLRHVLSAAAAECMLKRDGGADVSSLTNGLPSVLLEEMNR